MREYRIQAAPSSRKNRVGAHVWVDSSGRIASYNGGYPPTDMFGLRCTDCAGDLTAGAYLLRPVEHYLEGRVGERVQRCFYAVQGYSVQSEAGGRPTVIHPTLAAAEAEAMRLANANTGIAFYVQPMYAGKAISKASVPKPVATLEKL